MAAIFSMALMEITILNRRTGVICLENVELSEYSLKIEQCNKNLYGLHVVWLKFHILPVFVNQEGIPEPR